MRRRRRVSMLAQGVAPSVAASGKAYSWVRAVCVCLLPSPAAGACPCWPSSSTPPRCQTTAGATRWGPAVWAAPRPSCWAVRLIGLAGLCLPGAIRRPRRPCLFSRGIIASFMSTTVAMTETVLLCPALPRPPGAALAMKKRWQALREAAGKDTTKPNLVMGAETHVCWQKYGQHA